MNFEDSFLDFADIEQEYVRGPCLPNARILLGYAVNVLRGVEAASDEADALICWLARNRERLGLSPALFDKTDGERGRRNTQSGSIGSHRWRAISKAVTERFERAETPAPTPDVADIEAGLQNVVNALNLLGLDAALFALFYRYRTDSLFERLFDALATARRRSCVLRRYPDIFALLLNVTAAEINIHIRSDSLLMTSGAVVIDRDGDIRIPGSVCSLVERCGHGNIDVRGELLGKRLHANLPWSAFRHLGQEIEIARSVLRNAVASAGTKAAQKGVHILIYGSPGTGKTECAQSLAHELNVPLYAIGEQSPEGHEPDRGARLSSMLLAQRIGGGSPVLYLFDEAEDLFRPRTREREADPKIFIHRLLESSTVPTIWAANELEAFSPALLRRMTMCIEVRLPGQARRAELWQDLAIEEGVAMDQATAGRLARLIPSAPSVARTALRAARLADGRAETAALVAGGIARAIGHGRAPVPEMDDQAGFNPDLSNADAHLGEIARRLARPEASRAVSLLLAGPPGTGKTAYARHLASCMGLEIIQKRGSDLFGPYVGQTEARIAAAFAEARSAGAFLLFDEADSLLLDRTNAVRGWELSQVNEMLTWMEHHNLPFACTTNLPDRLDKASLRRFLVRVNFSFLRSDQASTLFELHFRQPAPVALGRLDRLTPADFSRVAARCAILGQEMSASDLVAQLATESEGREGAARLIGFSR